MPTKDQPEKSYVVEVIPIVRGVAKSTLSYFTRENLPTGSFVRIEVRKSTVLGLVIKSFDAHSIKTDLKRSSYSLKKLSLSEKGARLSPSFIRAAESCAKYYATTIGSVLGILLPKFFLDSPQLLGSEFSPNTRSLTIKEPLLIQFSDQERYMEYMSIVRESFAKSKSVLFIAPTAEDALRAHDILSKGIKEYAYTTGDKGQKAVKDILLKIQKEKHPILFVTTPAFIAFDRPDMETVIFEKENSRTYKAMSRPFVDLRIFIEFLAKESGKTLIFGDSVLSLNSIWKEKQGKFAELSPLKWKLSHGVNARLVDMKPAVIVGEEKEKRFKIFSNELVEMIEKAQKEKRKVFLFGARKGLSPSTICKDCGSVLVCQNCSAPIVLHKMEEGRIYMCHACGAKRPSETRCDKCNSWDLTPLGIGIDRIKEELERLFPDIPISVLDKDHAKTKSKAEAIAKKFASDKGGILIGTEFALSYIEKVPYVAIVSLDSLFSIPDFGINERIFYLTSRLLEKAEFESIVQTRNIGKIILQDATKGDVLEFYRKEVKEREELNYPPFSLFIKVRIECKQSEIGKKANLLQTMFSDFKPDFIKERGMRSGKIALSMILRIKRDAWPDPELCDKLLLLTPDFLIKVDPESIL
ncbi:MAG: primosomal protein N' (replication factor Y) (superfamily II helicase) [Parcubacteria bacterium C7867-005]|nr:MAG: primosomal protein N' (replication factor Y) (superfamily II helicase) [Parcubacteria bacterium C7867-005]